VQGDSRHTEADSQPGSQRVTPAFAPIAADQRPNVTLVIQLRENGNARWQVRTEFYETEGFEQLAAEFENGSVDMLQSFEAAIVESRAATGRSMRIRNVSRSSALRDNGSVGTLTLSFTWTNFARTEGTRLYVGDAFNTTAENADSQKWLSLTERQTLVVRPPPDYSVFSTPIPVSNRVARWEGPRTFSGREPWIVYEGSGTPTPSPTATPTTPPPTTPPTTTAPATTPPTTTAPPTTPATSTTTTGAGPPTTTAPPTTPPPGSGVSLSTALLLVLAVIIAVVIAAYTLQGNGGLPLGAASDGGDGGDTDGGEAAAEDSTATAAESGDSLDGDEAAAGAAAADDDEVDETLLSDEERVEHLLEENGSRMKQASIVKETGWSNAKVSQLLSSMEEEGRIDKLRIGRENLISFPDEDVTDFDSE
jgi:uncharacterized membrane protein